MCKSVKKSKKNWELRWFQGTAHNSSIPLRIYSTIHTTRQQAHISQFFSISFYSNTRNIVRCFPSITNVTRNWFGAYIDLKRCMFNCKHSIEIHFKDCSCLLFCLSSPPPYQVDSLLKNLNNLLTDDVHAKNIWLHFELNIDKPFSFHPTDRCCLFFYLNIGHCPNRRFETYRIWDTWAWQTTIWKKFHVIFYRICQK